MKRVVSFVATILVGTLFLGSIANQGVEGGGPAPYSLNELEYVLVLPDGSRASAHFLVRAGDVTEATGAASAAVRAIHPGAVLEDISHEEPSRSASEEAESEGEGVVRAQWNAWGWQWNANELPVPVRYNSEGAPSAFIPADVSAALAVWSVVDDSSFAYLYEGETTLPASMNVDGPDGVNVVAWQDMGCDSGCVLGLTTKSFESHEADVSLNSNPGANLGLGNDGSWDAVSVLIHELGHMAGLEHSCPALGPCTEEESEAVMFYAYSGVQRSLEADDVAALQALYPQAPATALPSVSEPTGDGIIDATSSSLFVPLTSGWNLTYLPAGDLQRFVTELDCVEGIYGWNGTNGWERWIRGLTPSMQTLRSTTAGTSYWVLASGECAAFFYD